MVWWRANAGRHDAWRDELGVYALGLLGRVRAAGLRSHLRGCAPCRAELVKLEEVAAWLARETAALKDCGGAQRGDAPGLVR